MEPMSDRELDDLLASWHAPSVPHGVEHRIAGHQKANWGRRLLNGNIQVPVPAAAVIVICTIVLFAALLARVPGANELRSTRSEGLKPVKHLQVHIIRSKYEAGH